MVLRPRTVGALDMGGASMQIALEITTNLQLEEMQEKDKNQIVEINLGCTDHDVEHTYRVFVSTYLGFGANQAKERHERTLFLDAVLKDVTEGRTEKKRIKDPCRPLGMMDNITLSLDLENYNLTAELKSRLEEHPNIYFYGTGDWESCYAALENFTKMGEQFLSCSQ
ncbi:ectonucleoside triphosphate diphosphohydrolase 7, partial [Eurytemora carolleeae]|uniref:ectonucleoside triphosphate diphosphohydrolase 7 n=1 Tax=Eurytemora carolleeae TaxID=1294199 RepID=UPI000C77D09A